MSKPELPPIEHARQNIAERYAQPYTKRAILRGEWDNGYLVRDERLRIEKENRDG